MTDFRGQTENAGHLRQPATMAIGHTVTLLFLTGGIAATRYAASTLCDSEAAARYSISSYSGSVRNSAKVSCVLICSKICAARS